MREQAQGACHRFPASTRRGCCLGACLSEGRRACHLLTGGKLLRVSVVTREDGPDRKKITHFLNESPVGTRPTECVGKTLTRLFGSAVYTNGRASGSSAG